MLLVPKDPNDSHNAILEIRGAAGGDEGNIFAGDLFRMYSKYAEAKGWRTEVIEMEDSEAGGSHWFHLKSMEKGLMEL